MKEATFYHAGCPVCVSAEKELVNLIDSSKVKVNVVHLGGDKVTANQAKDIGVTSVPALALEDGQILHINFGASIEDLV